MKNFLTPLVTESHFLRHMWQVPRHLIRGTPLLGKHFQQKRTVKLYKTHHTQCTSTCTTILNNKRSKYAFQQQAPWCYEDPFSRALECLLTIQQGAAKLASQAPTYEKQRRFHHGAMKISRALERLLLTFASIRTHPSILYDNNKRSKTLRYTRTYYSRIDRHASIDTVRRSQTGCTNPTILRDAAKLAAPYKKVRGVSPSIPKNIRRHEPCHTLRKQGAVGVQATRSTLQETYESTEQTRSQYPKGALKQLRTYKASEQGDPTQHN